MLSFHDTSFILFNILDDCSWSKYRYFYSNTIYISYIQAFHDARFEILYIVCRFFLFQYCVVMVVILFVQIAAVVIAAIFQSKVSIWQANIK